MLFRVFDSRPYLADVALLFDRRDRTYVDALSAVDAVGVLDAVAESRSDLGVYAAVYELQYGDVLQLAAGAYTSAAKDAL